MRFAQPLVIALICVAFSPSVHSHVFDKTSIEIVGTGKTDTFTIMDRSGCTATTDISIQDPTIAAVDPIKTGFVATFTYTVKALKTGKTTLLVRWAGNAAAGCFDSGTQEIQVTVKERCPEDAKAGVTFNLLGEPARADAALGIRLTFITLERQTVAVNLQLAIAKGDTSAQLAQKLRTALTQATAAAGFTCIAVVTTTQFDSVLKVVLTCDCVLHVDAAFTSPETAEGTGISIVHPPPPPPPGPEKPPENPPTDPTVPDPPPPTDPPTTPTDPPPPPPEKPPTTPTDPPPDEPPPTDPPPTSTPGEVVVPGINLDIHPIQVVQSPPFEELQENVPLIAEKATMVRVFLIWSPPDPTVLRNVVCRINADGRTDSVTADVYYVRGKTYVIPQGSQSNPMLPGYSDVIRLRNAHEAFNFEFTQTQGHYPNGAVSNIEARLDISGQTVTQSTEQFPLRRFPRTLHIAFRTIESLDKPLIKNATDLAAFARLQFDRITAVYPVPHSRAQMFFTAEPTRISGTLGAFSTWLLEASLNTPGRTYIDLDVMIAAGKIPAQRNRPGRSGMIEDWAGSGTHGYAPWYLDRTVYISETADSFTVAHEYGHKIIGLGHSDDSADNGWDVRHVTSRIAPYKPGGPGGDFQALMWVTANSDNDGWITVEEYMELIEELTVPADSGRSLAIDQSALESRIVISGQLTGGSTALLNPFFLTDHAPTAPANSGPYAVRLFSASGTVLHQQAFHIEPPPAIGSLFNPLLPVQDVRSDIFLLTVPFPPQTARIHIVQTADGTVLAERTVTPNAPTISVTAIRPDPTTGTIEVELNARDADGDSLHSVVSYTPDGLIYMPVDVEWLEPNRRLRFPMNAVPGSKEGRVRVLVTDGVRSAEVHSSPTLFADQKPLVSIVEPTPNSVFASNLPMVFRGIGYDLEDGILPGTKLEWRLDGQTQPIGSGERLILQNLTVGPHILNLNATDATGANSQAQMQFTVLSPNSAPVLSIQMQSNRIILHWTGLGTLQSSPSVAGPWTDLNGATNPYPVAINQPATFYRLRR